MVGYRLIKKAHYVFYIQEEEKKEISKFFKALKLLIVNRYY